MRPFWNMFDTTIITMACLRFISGFIEITAAVLILFGNDVKKALFINSLLALIGPLIMLASISIGLFSIADQLSYGKFVFIGLGVAFIFIGIYK
ncbi:hypothetical protein BEH_19600 [Priestia filamentosa]|uniref:DUF2619 domain-containing protein n=1 Tax=Priestia filamentosa TaxID=1402861 RepID=A0A0H4L0E6_9BACI|nr:YqhV family protein [Priestia filamentosa]AKO94103.1 hypothetical protein BEH_19600 [Priestia filamentosa]